MKTYIVKINRIEYYSAEIEVEAEDEEKAKEIAQEEAGTDEYELVNAEEEVLSIEEKTGE
jgi:hypothetical protein